MNQPARPASVAALRASRTATIPEGQTPIIQRIANWLTARGENDAVIPGEAKKVAAYHKAAAAMHDQAGGAQHSAAAQAHRAAAQAWEGQGMGTGASISAAASGIPRVGDRVTVAGIGEGEVTQKYAGKIEVMFVGANVGKWFMEYDKRVKPAGAGASISAAADSQTAKLINYQDGGVVDGFGRDQLKAANDGINAAKNATPANLRHLYKSGIRSDRHGYIWSWVLKEFPRPGAGASIAADTRTLPGDKIKPQARPSYNSRDTNSSFTAAVQMSAFHKRPIYIVITNRGWVMKFEKPSIAYGQSAFKITATHDGNQFTVQKDDISPKQAGTALPGYTDQGKPPALEEGAKGRRRQIIKARVMRGEKLPAKVLEEFKGEPWVPKDAFTTGASTMPTETKPACGMSRKAAYLSRVAMAAGGSVAAARTPADDAMIQNNRQLWQNLRNYLLPMKPDELKREYQIAVEQGDQKRAALIKIYAAEDGLKLAAGTSISAATSGGALAKLKAELKEYVSGSTVDNMVYQLERGGSAIGAVQHSLSGIDVPPAVMQKAARLLDQIVKPHGGSFARASISAAVTKQMDHAGYQRGLKSKTPDELKYIIKDAREAMQAMPQGPNAGYYQDEIHYAQMELKKRQGAGASIAAAGESKMRFKGIKPATARGYWDVVVEMPDGAVRTFVKSGSEVMQWAKLYLEGGQPLAVIRERLQRGASISAAASSFKVGDKVSYPSPNASEPPMRGVIKRIADGRATLVDSLNPGDHRTVPVSMLKPYQAGGKELPFAAGGKPPFGKPAQPAAPPSAPPPPPEPEPDPADAPLGMSRKAQFVRRMLAKRSGAVPAAGASIAAAGGGASVNVSRQQHDAMIDGDSAWMKTVWPKLKKTWGVGGATVTGTPEQIAELKAKMQRSPVEAKPQKPFKLAAESGSNSGTVREAGELYQFLSSTMSRLQSLNFVSPEVSSAKKKVADTISKLTGQADTLRHSLAKKMMAGASVSAALPSEQYQGAHGKKPRGRGTWIIGIHKGGWEPSHKEGVDHVTFNGLYADAVKAAKAKLPGKQLFPYT